MPTLLGVYERPDQVAAVVTRLRARGYTELETYSPAPFAEVDDAVIEKPSRVRLFTLIGGLTGVVTGYAMTIWMSNDWAIRVGGKPFSSIPPYTIIGFELTVLFGGLLTVLGLFVFGRLPSLRTDPEYGARFSAEDFGVRVACRDRDVAEIDLLLRDHGASEVTLVG
jgi:molybdopterin-containing oxidoreductase family membrane subunit